MQSYGTLSRSPKLAYRYLFHNIYNHLFVRYLVRETMGHNAAPHTLGNTRLTANSDDSVMPLPPGSTPK